MSFQGVHQIRRFLPAEVVLAKSKKDEAYCSGAPQPIAKANITTHQDNKVSSAQVFQLLLHSFPSARPIRGINDRVVYVRKKEGLLEFARDHTIKLQRG